MMHGQKNIKLQRKIYVGMKYIKLWLWLKIF